MSFFFQATKSQPWYDLAVRVFVLDKGLCHLIANRAFNKSREILDKVSEDLSR